MTQQADTKHTLSEIPTLFAQPAADLIAKLPRGGVQLDYVGHGDITMMLLAVDPNWSWRPIEFADDGSPLIRERGGMLVMWGYLTVLGMERLGVGSCEKNKAEAEKELVGDLLRNASMRFGFCTKLWSKTAGLPSMDEVAVGHRGDPTPAQAAQLRAQEAAAAGATTSRAAMPAPAHAPTAGSFNNMPIPGKGRNAGKKIDDLATGELENEWKFWQGRLSGSDPKWLAKNEEFVIACGLLLRARTGNVYAVDGRVFAPVQDPNHGGYDDRGVEIPF